MITYQRTLLLILSLISIVYSQVCVDYTAATLISGPGQYTVLDTTCTANLNPFPVGLTLEVGLIDEENLQIFYIPPQPDPAYELTADTCASNFDTNMVIFVYNTVFNTYTFVDNSDDYCGLQSRLQIAVSDEQQVYIAIAGFNSSTSGDLVLTISMNSSAVTTIDQIKFISDDIEQIASSIFDMTNAIAADTSLATADTNIASINSIGAAILTEYDAGGLVDDMTTYVSSLSNTLTQLGTDATALQTSIADRITTDTTDYDAAVGNINTAITTLAEQATNITTDISTSQTTSSNIDSSVTTLKTGLDSQITTFSSLNTYFSSALGSIESSSFTTFVSKYLAMTSTTSVPPILMSPNEYNGRLEDVASIMNTLISNLPVQDPACATFMTSYSANLAAAMYITAFANLQSAYQCYY